MLRVILLIIMLCVPTASYAAGDAKKFVTELSDKIFGVMNDSARSKSDKEKELAAIFEKYVDTDWMAMFVAGKYAKDLSAEQKKEYLALYHDYLIYAYVPRFQEFSGTSYEIQRVQDKGKEILVQVTLKGLPNKPDIRTEYRLRKDAASKYKVIDLSGENVSMIVTQRADFGGMIASKGWEYFLEKLGAKVKGLVKEKGDLR